MNKRVRRKTDMGDRVVEFGTHPDLALTAPITALFTQAATVVTALKARASDQASGTGAFRGGAQQCRLLAREIRRSMLEISEIAKVLKPSDLPGASEIFRMPRGNPSFQTLLAAARHFAEDVEPHKALFIARALPATFVDDLEGKITAFEAAIQSKAGGRATRVGGTSGLEIQAKALMEIVQELRAIMRVHLKSNPALLDAWKSAARVERDHPSTDEEQPPVPTDGSGSGAGTAVAS